MVQVESNMETLTTNRKTNFSIAAIMSGIQATTTKTEPVDVADTSIDKQVSDDSSDNLPALDKVVKKEKKSKISEECYSDDLASVTCPLLVSRRGETGGDIRRVAVLFLPLHP